MDPKFSEDRDVAFPVLRRSKQGFVESHRWGEKRSQNLNPSQFGRLGLLSTKVAATSRTQRSSP
jgi:hypothetical protein